LQASDRFGAKIAYFGKINAAGSILGAVPRRQTRQERFPAKWTPVRVKKTRQNKK
jgi:hypothetical protein